MKRLLLVLLLIPHFLLSQNDVEIDTFNRVLFNEIKKLPIESNLAKPIIVDKLTEILESTSDTILQNKISVYKNEIEALEFKYEFKADLNKISKKELRGFEVNEDKFNGMTFIKYQRYLGEIYPYIVYRDGIMFLRLVTNYTGDDWIFMEDAVVLVGDNDYHYSLVETDRKVTSYGVREYSDVLVTSNLFKMLQDIHSSDKDISIRMKGKYRADRTLGKKQKEGIVLLLDIFNKMKVQ